MNDVELNDRLVFLADMGETYIVRGLEDTGKALPYYGWFWRSVDFSRPLSLAATPDGFVGFCENNKWGYAEAYVSAEQTDALRKMLEEVAGMHPKRSTKQDIEAHLQAIFDFMQTLWPEGVSKQGYYE